MSRTVRWTCELCGARLSATGGLRAVTDIDRAHIASCPGGPRIDGKRGADVTIEIPL
jgi:hypothetical protein